MVSISPLEMIVRNKNNQIKKSITINEFLEQSRQAAKLSIKQGSRQIIKLVSDGILFLHLLHFAIYLFMDLY